MDIKDVQHLAVLARLDIPEEEQQSLLADLTSILGYIDQVRKAALPESAGEAPAHRNICRDDEVTNTGGAYTTAMLAAAPATQDGFVKVKKVL
jgi:aspartyl-tRNA(Asn)/glutamyl-tRNA(Gln) amidotransferase subunit C